ncbi:SIMPL domain-containing protein [Luteirhabdus pelagi]|uniref:SIMPL domain-containing protein n=1 Tax=Luteirhabdus pelagi TaxID=2792783 RepID=UPI0019394FB0|nr:SIMPL domain-containing protein [Luteirhabdus pelagi]
MNKIVTFIALVIVMSTNAQQQQQMIPTVDVTGEGTVRVVPDKVEIQVRVENTGKNATLVKQQNDKTVSEVIKFIKSMNIADKDIQTQYIRLNKNYNYNEKSYSYSANQSIAITLRDLKKYEDLMNGLLQSGINRIDGVSFASSNQEEMEREARTKAIMDAKQRATDYASVLDQSIGKAVSISEFSSSPNYPQPMYRAMAVTESDASGGQAPIAPGELEIKVKVNVRFELN